MPFSVTEQSGFSSVLFDTLFGLILYFSLDSILELDGANLVFYLFSIVVVVHWWLLFKSVDDSYGEETSKSVTDLVLGITDLVLLEYVVLFARGLEHQKAAVFLMVLLAIDLVWAMAWRYLGSWGEKDKLEIARMEQELSFNIRANAVTLALMGGLLLAGGALTAPWFIGSFIAIYLLYIFMTLRYRIIDLDLF